MKRRMAFLLLVLMVIISLSACKHEHQFGDWTVVKEAGCIEDGLKERSCKCGEKETEVLPKTGHSFGEWTVVKEANYENDGLMERTCKCGEKETEVLPKKDIPRYKLGEIIKGDDFEMVITNVSFNRTNFDYCKFDVTVKNTGKTQFHFTRFYFAIIYGDGYEYPKNTSYSYNIEPLSTKTISPSIDFPYELSKDNEQKMILIKDHWDKETKSYLDYYYVLLD